MNRTSKLMLSGLVVGPLAALAVLMGGHTAAPATATVPAPAPVVATVDDVDLSVCATHPGAHRMVIQEDQLDQACVQNLRNGQHRG